MSKTHLDPKPRGQEQIEATNLKITTEEIEELLEALDHDFHPNEIDDLQACIKLRKAVSRDVISAYLRMYYLEGESLERIAGTCASTAIEGHDPTLTEMKVAKQLSEDVDNLVDILGIAIGNVKHMLRLERFYRDYHDLKRG